MHVASGRAGLCSWKLYGDPELSISSRKLESFRHDTGHDIRLIIDDYGLPDDLRISTELSFPQAVTQDRHLRLSRKPFGAVEPAAQCRFNAENREKVGSRLYSVEPFRCSFPGQIESIPEVCREILEGIRLLFPIQVIPRGYVGVWIAQTRIFFPNHHEAVRLMKGKRLEKNSIDNTKDGRVRPDAEAHNQHRQQSESGIPAHHANGILQIPHHVFYKMRFAHIPAFFLALLDAAHGTELVVQFLLHTPPPEQRPQSERYCI